MTGTGRGEFVGVDEESSVRIAGIDGNHSVVDVFLGTFGVITRGQKSTSGVGSAASFQSSGLGVVVVSVSVFLGYVLEDDSPVSFDVNGSGDFSVIDVRRTQITFGSDPVSGVVRRVSFGSSGVVSVIEGIFLIFSDVFD